jgi:hypothetical protein
MSSILLMIKIKQILGNNYGKYFFISFIGTLLSREILLDIPMVNESRVPLKIKETDTLINAFVHSLILTFLIFIYEVMMS